MTPLPQLYQRFPRLWYVLEPEAARRQTPAPSRLSRIETRRDVAGPMRPATRFVLLGQR